MRKNSSVSLFYCREDMAFGPVSRTDLRSVVTSRHTQYDDAQSQWDGRGFAITAYSEAAKTFLRDLRAAFIAGDVAAWIGGGHDASFSRGGLIIAIASRVPEETRRTMLEDDKDAARLEKAAEATGIRKRLQQARQNSGKPVALPPYGYFALSPRWVKNFRRMDDDKPLADSTAHPVFFWLNPYRQSEFNTGWFTVEELDQWIAGTGPVVKSSRSAA